MYTTLNNPKTFGAGGDVYVCRFVKFTSNAGSVVQAAAASDAVIGVSTQDERLPSTLGGTADLAAASGQGVKVFTVGQEAVLELGTGGCTAGNTLESDANGKGVVSSATAGKTYAAIALETGVAGDRVRVWIQPGNKST